MSGNLLSVDQLGRGVRRFATVEVPFLEGTSVRIRSLTEYEQSKFESAQLSKRGGMNRNAVEASRRKFVAMCVVDDAGEPYLVPSDLMDADSRLVNFLFRECSAHCGMSDDEAADMVGNSKAVRD